MHSEQLQFIGNREDGWIASLPGHLPKFFSLPVTVHIVCADPDGTPNSDDVLLAEEILEHFDEVVDAAEKAFAEYQTGVVDDWLTYIADPHK